MSTGIKRPLDFMSGWAEWIVAPLRQYCLRLEIAGSVRRQKELCGDLEVVCIADGPMLHQRLSNSIDTGLIWLTSPRRWGNKQKSFLFGTDDGDVQVDVFITTPEEWGYTYLVRTGSAGFSNRMVTPTGRNTSSGLPGLMPKHLYCKDCRVRTYDNIIFDTPEEDDIFNLWGIEFVPPNERTDIFKPVPRKLTREARGHPITQASLF